MSQPKFHCISSDSDSEGDENLPLSSVLENKISTNQELNSQQNDLQSSEGNNPVEKKARITNKKFTADKVLKEQQKAKQQEEREAKKRAQEMERQKKRLLQETRKQAKPGECLKYILVSVDTSLMNHSAGAGILTQLQTCDIKYEVRPQPHKSIITFWREVTEVKEEGDKIDSVSKEIVEDEILLYLTADECLNMVHAFQQKKNGLYSENDVTLTDCVLDTKKKLEGRNITLLVQGIEKYYRDQKTSEQRAYRKKIVGDEGKKNKKISNALKVSRIDMEEALVDLQLQTDCNIKFFEKDIDVAKCVLSYTKSVAEAPFKRERMTTGFTFHIDGTGSTKVDKDGSGLSKVWRQQLQQYKSVTADVANAIIAKYSSPVQLYKAYEQCRTEKEAELLLQDIEVRRGVGVMATSRRIGKELSRRFYHLMTSTDGDFVIT